jgi:translation initiation factor IF-3
VRLIDSKGKQLGVFPREEALKMARDGDMDLLEVAPQADPPVCRVIDYGKFKYQEEKRRKKNKKPHDTNILKEVRLGYRIGEHDFEIKCRKVLKFLEEGHKVKVVLRFRGREMIYQDRGREMLKRLVREVEDIGKAMSSPLPRGRRLEQYLLPKSAK